MTAMLSVDDAAVQTRDRFRLRRASDFADFELRVENLRVYYRIAGDQVRVVLIGRKQGNRLVIDGKGFTL